MCADVCFEQARTTRGVTDITGFGMIFPRFRRRTVCLLPFARHWRSILFNHVASRRSFCLRYLFGILYSRVYFPSRNTYQMIFETNSRPSIFRQIKFGFRYRFNDPPIGKRNRFSAPALHKRPGNSVVRVRSRADRRTRENTDL